MTKDKGARKWAITKIPVLYVAKKNFIIGIKGGTIPINALIVDTKESQSHE